MIDYKVTKIDHVPKIDSLLGTKNRVLGFKNIILGYNSFTKID